MLDYTLNEDDIIASEIRFDNYINIIESISLPQKKDKPHIWAENNITLTKDVSELDGRFSYDPTPFWREVVDCASPDHPAKVVFVIKSGQTGCTQCVVVPLCCWKIAQNPGNIMVTSGNEQLSKEFVSTRLDPAIKSAGIQHLVRSNVIKKKNAKTGDTDSHKQFAGGNLFACSVGAIDTVGKQKSLQTIIADDWSASKLSDKKQGNLFDIIQQRLNTSAFTQKGFYISTPEMRPDPTELGYLKGDQRKYHMPCPCCEEMIDFQWTVDIEGTKCGIIYETDEHGKLIKGTVNYKCPKCFAEFPESEKFRMMEIGKWIPTAEPEQEGWYSYHISALYGAPNMMSWETIVIRWLEIFENGKTDTDKLKAFKNLILGEAYEDRASEVTSALIIENMPGYKHGTVPNRLSNDLGCGDIMFLTAGVDCGGSLHDARLDWEIVGWTENGQSFSIDQGSIGTYSNSKRAQNDERRIRYSYVQGEDNCVWDVLEEIMGPEKYYPFDEGDISMGVDIVCIDSGYLPDIIDQFVASGRITAVKIKGVFQKNGFHENLDKPRYTKSSSELNLFNINTDVVKNDVVRNMNQKFDIMGNPTAGLMLFPDATHNKYQYTKFFRQLEGEHKIPKMVNGKVSSYIWQKKPGYQNHFFDARCYAVGAMHIFIDEFMQTKRAKLSDFAERYKESKK